MMFLPRKLWWSSLHSADAVWCAEVGLYFNTHLDMALDL